MARKAKENATLVAEIRDMLFLDTNNSDGEFYNPNKEIDSDVIGEVVNKVMEHYQDMFIECSLCGCLCDREKSHLHQGGIIGDNCCWDDRLKASE